METTRRVSPPPANKPQGTSLAGRYQLLVTLGRGGMADVYLAVARGPLGFNKLVVLKRLRSVADDDGRSLEMFVDEARLAARLSHPNIVDTYDAGQEDNAYFIAMEYLDGQSVRRLLKSGDREQIDHTTWVRIAADALHGLHHAHELRDYDGTPLEIVHRDVSPDNIFVTYEGTVKVVDFGIAKATTNMSQTEAGVFKGKLTYMAPEQAMGADVDRRADIFSMGVVLWEALAGRKRLEGGMGKALIKLVHSDVPTLASVRPDIDPRLAGIVDRALQKEPDARYATAAEMRDALEAYLREKPNPVTKVELGQLMTNLFSDHRSAVRRQVEQHLAAVAQSTAEGDFWDSSRMRVAGEATGSVLAQVSGEEFSPLASTSSLFPQPQPLTGPVPVPQKAPWARRWTVVLAVAALTALVAVFVFRSPALPPATSGALGGTGRSVSIAVLVESEPSAALVAWDGEPRGRTPLSLKLPRGPQTLILSREGYASQTLLLDLTDADGAVTRTVTLKPEPAPEPTASSIQPRARPLAARRGRVRSSVTGRGSNTQTLASAQEPAPSVAASATPAAALAEPAPEPAPARPPGSMDPAAVSATVRAHRPEVQACFDRARMDTFDLHGHMSVRVTVDPTGHVLSTAVTNAVEGGARLQACVVGAVQRWAFPAPAGGVNGSASFPIVFE